MEKRASSPLSDRAGQGARAMVRGESGIRRLVVVAGAWRRLVVVGVLWCWAWMAVLEAESLGSVMM